LLISKIKRLNSLLKANLNSSKIKWLREVYRAESHNNVYGFDIQLFEEVDFEASKWNTKGRNIILNIVKKNLDQEYWPRLTKDKVKN